MDGATAPRRKPFVYVGHPAKSLLKLIPVGGKKAYPKDPPGPPSPDIVLIPCSQVVDFDAFLSQLNLPDEVWAQARAGDGRVVFDLSMEGRPHDAARSEALHAFLERVGVGLDRAVYVTQDRGYAADYADFCREAGVRPAMRIVNYDYWIRRFVRDYERDGEAVFERRLEAYRARPRRRDRRFVCLNLTPRPTKVLFLLSLMRDGLWDEGFISFGGFSAVLKYKNKTVYGFMRDVWALQGFDDLSAELEPLIPTLDSLGEILLEEPGRSRAPGEALTQDVALPEYARSWFSVVTETEMSDRLHRITEKPFKALANFHPLIFLGNPGSLALLHRLGFETFGEMIDEAYDEETDPRRRFDMVRREVQRLCRLDESELARLEGVVSEKVVFNARRALIELPRVYREELDPAFLDEIMAPLPASVG